MRAPARRGLLIPTALFLALVVFSLVTAVQLLIKQNHRAIRWGHVRTQARYLALAGAHRLMALMEEDPSLEKRHAGSRSAWVEVGVGGRLEAWVEQVTPAQDDVMLVMGRGTHESGLVEKVGLVVERRREDVDAVLVRPSLPETGTVCVLSHDSKHSASHWDEVPAPHDVESTVNELGDCAPDSHGIVYAVHRREAGDRVLRLDLSTRSWLVLPEAQGWLPGARIARLATGGERWLFAEVDARRDSYRGILRRDLATGSARWERLRATGPTDDLCGDARGLACVRSEDGSLVKGSEKGWDEVPNGPTDRYRLVQLPDRHERDVMPLQDRGARISAHCLDPHGRLFAISSHEGLDTLSQFDVATRQWVLMPPLPMALAGKATARTVQGRILAAGASGRLYVSWRRGGENAIYCFEPVRQAYRALPELPEGLRRARGVEIVAGGTSDEGWVRYVEVSRF